MIVKIGIYFLGMKMSNEIFNNLLLLDIDIKPLIT